MTDDPVRTLSLAAAAVCATIPIGRVIDRLRAGENGAAGRLAALIQAEIPAFRQSRNAEAREDLGTEAALLTDELVRLLEGGEMDALDFARRAGRRRAAARFPLEAMLHGFRVAQKFLLGWLREAGEVDAALTDVVLEYVHVVSTLFAGAYLEEIRRAAESAGDRRAELLRILLDGYDESDPRVSGLLREAGFLAGHQAFVVGLARPRQPVEMHNPARAGRLADAFDDCLAEVSPRRVLGVREGRVVFVIADVRRLSGYTRKGVPLASRAADALGVIGPIVHIGLSADVVATARIPAALAQAELALSLADDRHRVAAFAAIPLRRVLVRVAERELRPLLPDWAGPYLEADRSFTRTLDAYADCDMNVLKTAKRLRVHPNTIYARFERIEELSGLDPRRYHALGELLTVAQAAGEATSSRDRR